MDVRVSLDHVLILDLLPSVFIDLLGIPTIPNISCIVILVLATRGHAEVGALVATPILLFLASLRIAEIVSQGVHEFVVLLTAVVQVGIEIVMVLEVVDGKLGHIIESWVLAPVYELRFVRHHVPLKGGSRSCLQLSPHGLVGCLVVALVFLPSDLCDGTFSRLDCNA